MLMQIDRFCSSIFLSHILMDKRGNKIFGIEILVLQFTSWEQNFFRLKDANSNFVWNWISLDSQPSSDRN